MHEAVFAVRPSCGASRYAFLRVWEDLAHFLQLRGWHTGEGHAIGLAAAKVGWPVAARRFLPQRALYKDRFTAQRLAQGHGEAPHLLAWHGRKRLYDFEWPRYCTARLGEALRRRPPVSTLLAVRDAVRMMRLRRSWADRLGQDVADCPSVSSGTGNEQGA